MNVYDKGLADMILAEACFADAIRHTEESMQDVATALKYLFANPENTGVALVVDADFVYAAACYDKYLRKLKGIQKTIREAGNESSRQSKS